jgi:DNA-binding NarL/FixJ family response regulator
MKALGKLWKKFRPPSQKDLVETTPPFVMLPTRKRLFFLEDDLFFVETMVQAASRFDVEITHAGSVKEAWVKLQEQIEPFNCMILDVRLANGSGVEFYRTVAKRWPATSVVFLTGYYNPELLRQIEAIGPARIYSKVRVADPNFLTSMLAQLGLTRTG